MDFSTADEHLALRQAVAAITAQFGNDYYTRKAEAREFTSELWQALGKHGYLGINIPEAYGGGGRAWSSSPSSARRPRRRVAPPAAAAGVQRHLRRGDLRLRHRPAACPVAAAAGHRRREDRLRDHRTGRRVEHAPAIHYRRPRRRGLSAARTEVLHLRHR